MRRLKNCLLAGFAFFGALTAAGANEQIVVQTDSTSIVYTVGQDGTSPIRQNMPIFPKERKPI